MQHCVGSVHSLPAHFTSWICPIPIDSIFLAALISLQLCTPHCMQLTVLADKSSFPHLNLQTEHTWLVGSHRSIITRSLPNFIALFEHIDLNSLQPACPMDLLNRRFLIMPFMFKSSRAITWFSIITLVDSLCKKSFLKSLCLACNFATAKRAASLLCDCLNRLFSLRCALRSFRSSLENQDYLSFLPN